MYECPICLDICHNISYLICGHRFHKTCLDRWFLLNNSCPICREQSNYIIEFHPVRQHSTNNLQTPIHENSISYRNRPFARWRQRHYDRARTRTSQSRRNPNIENNRNNLRYTNYRAVGQFRREEYDRIYASNITFY